MGSNKAKDMLKSYDFIVCGGGTSGCVIAGRLAEDPNTTVLVLEAGQDNENLETVHMAGGWSQNFDKETDWNIVSEPGAGINNRRVNLSRGRFLGGSSGCNGTLCVRGSKQDYDDWGLPGWSGEEFFQYMNKAESFTSKPWFQASKQSHGYSGHLHTEPFDLGPISELLRRSMESKGLPFDADMFSHGENPHGCGHVPRTVHAGVRTTGADFITKKNKRANVTTVTGAHVDRVLVEKQDDGSLRAVGVTAVLADGTGLEVKANKEVIVSGGTYCSPNILNRSGIGAKEELEKHGITTIVDLPGVGKNLMDHLIVFLMYETDKPGLTLDHLLFHEGAYEKSHKLWQDEKKGALANIPFGIFAFARLDSRMADSQLWNAAPRKPGRDPMGLTPTQPNIELMTAESFFAPKQYNVLPTGGQHVFCIVPELFGAQSRGSVWLRSADATALPVVDCGYMSDPLDLEVMAEACRLANEIVVDGAGTKDIVKGSWPPEASHHELSTREDWMSHVKEHATTCYHASGTCAMGKESDESAVVDENLCVKGVKGLRVADCSIMPILHGGHSQMPAYGIGEKAADLIKATWGLKSAT
ncbi:GMC oxidoreductase [Hirsutella rhossiliensis]|uniref:GMC oxidoreductase domain-containing protein n=1 Tax=Hirsutella rhossiliensis TaxID=111463 RepID=A0A9P8SI39_9HYPO|nr:GMC oxidoreductase domain-containing protein [Hirsutella rhossiliensis]KAH0962210.1 GMC oxidoreductase domain-containing protein [Hirsutella rhossiliensis]